MTKIKKFLPTIGLLLILVLALLVRLYKIDSPIADWHSWRQVDTASVTRVFSQEGLDLLRPRYQDISNIPSGQENPQGWRMVEFPFYNFLHLQVFNFSGLNLETAGRLTSVLISLWSLVILYLIVKKISGHWVGLLSAFFFAFLPFSIFYSRVVLPEPLVIATFLTSFYFLLRLLETKKKLVSWSLVLLSSLFLAVSFLLKPYTGFFTLPFFLIFFLAFKKKKLNILQFVTYGLISITPFILWRLWIAQYPSGIPAFDWLFNMNNIRLRPAWFRWLFAERLSKLILGYFGTALLVFGLIKKPKKLSWVYLLWFIGILLYFIVIASGNITHDYYQAMIIPFLCALLAQGVSNIISLPKKDFPRLLTIPAVIVVTLFSLAFSWYEIKGYYQINHPTIIEAGQAVDKLLPQDARVIAPYQGDTAFLYQTNRYGWPLMTHDLDQMIDLGATHYVSVNYDQTTADIMDQPQFEPILIDPDFVIIQLSN